MQCKTDHSVLGFVHPPETMSRSFVFHFSINRCKRSRLIVFDERKTKLLPAPFRTRCRHHPESQLACFENCVQTITFKITGYYSTNFTRTLDQVPISDSVKINETTTELCKRKCSQPECEAREYEGTTGMRSTKRPLLPLVRTDSSGRPIMWPSILCATWFRTFVACRRCGPVWPWST